MVKRGLGKGFASLIPTDIVESEFDATAKDDEKVSDLRYIPIDQIEADPDQPRRRFDEEELNELANSLKEHGLLQPIVVTPRGGKYQVVAGERRLRAAKIAGFKEIQAIVRTLSAQHQLEISIVENVQRADLNPIETATAFAKLRTQFNMNYDDIGKRVGKAGTTVANTTRLLKLPEDAKRALMENKITEGHARQILALDEYPKGQEALLKEILQNKRNVRWAEEFVRAYKRQEAEGDRNNAKKAKRSVQSETPLTKKLAKRLGLKSKSVLNKSTAHGGSIIIKYHNDDEMRLILDTLSNE